MKRGFDTCLKGRDGRKKEKRQSNHHDVSQREKETCINACGASNLQLEINSGTCTDKMLIKSDRLSFLWQCGTFREELLPPSAFPQACRSCGEHGKTAKLSVVGSHSPNHCISAVGSPKSLIHPIPNSNTLHMFASTDLWAAEVSSPPPIQEPPMKTLGTELAPVSCFM